MRRILYGLVLFSCIWSCEQRENKAINELKLGLVETNKQLPITAAFFTLTRMEIIGNDYTVNGTFDEHLLDYDEFLTNMNQNKTGLFALVSGNHSDFADLFVESGLNLRFLIRGLPSMRQGEILLTADEIKSAYVSRKEAMDCIKAETSGKGLPHKIDEGSYLTAVYIDGDYLCYEFSLDDTEEIAFFREYKKRGNAMEIKIIDGSIKSDSASGSGQLIRNLRICGMGMKNIYKSTKTSESVCFTMTPELIESRFNELSVE